MNAMKRLLFLSLLFTFNSTFSQITVIQDSPDNIVYFLFGGCNAQGVQVSNITYRGVFSSSQCSMCSQFGRFNCQSVNDIGISKGIILSTGWIDSLGGNYNIFRNNDVDGGGDTDLNQVAGGSTHDICSIEFDIIPLRDTISFKFVFGSEEYPEYVNERYNDAFGIFITGPNPDGGYYSKKNIARVPGTNSTVCVDSINSYHNSSYYYANYGTLLTLDGYTIPITGIANVYRDSVYHFKICIADAGDELFNSDVFIESNIFNLYENLSLPNISTHQTGYACDAQTNVTAWISTTNGSPPFSFYWSTGITDTVAYNLADGNYYITITDSVGCTFQRNILVFETPVNISTGYTNPSCNGSDGSISVSVQGNMVEPYIFEWSNGIVDTSNIPNSSISGLSSDIYFVTVTNGLGCHNVRKIILSTTGAPLFAVQTTNYPTCNDPIGEILVRAYPQNSNIGPFLITLVGIGDTICNDSAVFSGLPPGMYTIYVADSNNCQMVDYHPLYASDIANISFTYTIIQTTVSFFTNSNYNNVLWDFGDGITSTLTNPTHTYISDGVDEVCLTYYNYCDTLTDCDDVFIILSSVPEYNISNVLIYPNPSSGIFRIKCNSIYPGSIIRLFDRTGRILFSAEIVSDIMTFNVSELEPGLYFLYINGRVHKVLIEYNN